MSIESTKVVMERYMSSEHSDVSEMSDDVVFTVMATGQEHHGPENILGMLNYFYHIAFEARAETTNMIIADGKCCLEANFVGKHIGEFAGVPATGKEVNVPLCVVYDLENDKIKRGRVYFEIPVFLTQVGATK
ncbi:MAG: ester cyclase [Candidatus Promineifilaceae bacterium]|nr:ester cyclase [Candidatus Promineifilaceae bacterium]